MTPEPLSIQALHSLTDWLVLSGVTVEINNYAAVYTLAASDPGPASSADTPKITAPAQSRQSIQEFKTLEELNNFCSSWKELGLAKTAAKAVLGSGPAASPALMVIGDLPDDSEDRNGQAFSSPTGQLIRQGLRQAGIAEKNVYFSYLSKWRTPAKRPLTVVERDLCLQILVQEIGLVAPRLILALGESTVKALCPAFAQNLGKQTDIIKYTNQYLKSETLLKASQKGELLVKNPLMKKNFWFSLLELADIMRTQDGLSPDAPDFNNAE